MVSPYHPASSISIHVTEDLHGFGLVAVDVDGVDATLQVPVLHELGAVHGEGVHEAHWERGTNNTGVRHPVVIWSKNNQ